MLVKKSCFCTEKYFLNSRNIFGNKHSIYNYFLLQNTTKKKYKL